ncbi:MAG: hypothetical protein GY859_18380 [Desulfobacterales bacterium]|nr:hypothetical protein [Desulfobacterales bacterium]
MKDMEAPEETMPWLFGAGYIRVASVTGAKAREWILPDLLSIYEREPLVLERFGARLMFEERYDDAFKVFDYKYKAVAHRRDVGLRMMAEAWRLGSRDEDALDQITERLKAFPQEWWLTRLVRYFTGDLDKEAILRSANNLDKICEIHTIMGAEKKREGDEVGAVTHLLIALETGRSMNTHYRRAFRLFEEIVSPMPNFPAPRWMETD